MLPHTVYWDIYIMLKIMIMNNILKPAIRVNIILYTRKYTTTTNSLKTYQGGSYESDFFGLNRSLPNKIITVYVLTCLIYKTKKFNVLIIFTVLLCTNGPIKNYVCLYACLSLSVLVLRQYGMTNANNFKWGLPLTAIPKGREKDMYLKEWPKG